MNTRIKRYITILLFSQCLLTNPVFGNKDSVFVPPIADAGTSAELDCGNETLQLDGTNSSQGNQFEYSWQTNEGNIISGTDSIIATVDSPGWYFLTVTDTSNDCFSVDSVEITQHADVPIVFVESPEVLSCQNAFTVLDGSNSSQGNQFSYEWTTQGGNIIVGENGLNPTISAPGFYTLSVTNEQTDCVGSYTVEVLQDLDIPDIDAGMPLSICNGGEVQLNGTIQGDTQNVTISWFTMNGSILNGEGTLNPTVGAPGLYFFNVEKDDCNNQDSVEVSLFDYPIVNIAAPDEISCENPEITLDGTNSSDNDNIAVFWLTLDGNIIGPDNDFTVQVNAPGAYFLEITDTVANCFVSETVIVNGFADFPAVEAGDTMYLTCVETTLTLNGSGSTGSNIFYEWDTPNGNIVSGEETLNPIVDLPGIYELIIWNDSTDCESVDTMVVLENLEPPDANANNNANLDCDNDTAELDGFTSSIGDEFIYEWVTSDGNVISAQDSIVILVDAPGNYMLTVTNTINGCTDFDWVEVTQDEMLPAVAIAPPAPFSCATSFIQLDGSNSSSGSQYNYTWTTSDGTIINGDGSPNPTIGTPGTYILTVLNTLNNCENSSEVTVDTDTIPPIIEILEADTLNCNIQEVTLDATNSSSDPSMIFQWSTQTGNIVSGSDSPNPVVDQPGIYELTLINTLNACSATQIVKVEDGGELPVAEVTVSDTLTCWVDFVLIDATGSSQGPQFSYFWETDGGNIQPGGSILELNATEGGIYEIFVINNENGCSSSASVELIADNEEPTADAGADLTIDCFVPILNLDGSNSSQGIEFQYSWTTTTGNIVSGANTLTPEIDEDGFYTIEVLNTLNGCTNTDLVQVIGNNQPPEVQIELPDLLTCAQTELQLDASNSSQGLNFQYNWTTADGNILSGSSTLTPEINSIGTYILTILDTDNNCTESNQVLVEQDITPPGVDAGQPIELNCNLSEISLNGNVQNVAIPSLLWTTADGNILSGEMTLEPLVNKPGTYSLTVINTENGCSSSDAVVISESILIDFDYELTNPTCLEPFGNVLFGNVNGGNGPYQYSINSGASFQSDPIFENLDPGPYILQIQDSDDCILEASIEISDAQSPAIFLEELVALQLGDSYEIIPTFNILESEIAEILWTPAIGLDCSDCLTPIATPTQNTEYTVQIMDNQGCFGTATIQIFVQKGLGVYIPNVFSPNGDGNNDVFTILAKPNVVAQVYALQIFDRWGAHIYSAENFSPNDAKFGWDGEHKGEALGAGVYVYFAEIEFVDGRREILKGDVLLLR